MAQDYTSIRVSEAAKTDADEAKRDDETWDDYLRRCTANPPPVREFVPADGVGIDADVVAQKIVDHLLAGDLHPDDVAQLADAMGTVEERTGRIERLLEDLQR